MKGIILSIILHITFFGTSCGVKKDASNPEPIKTVTESSFEERSELPDCKKYIFIDGMRGEDFYSGITNMFYIHTNFNRDSLIVKVRDGKGSVKKQNQHYFCSEIRKPGLLYIDIYHKSDTVEKIYADRFKVHSLPTGKPMVGNKSDGDTFDINLTMRNLQLRVYSTLEGLDLLHTVKGFKLRTYSDGEFILNESQSSYFTIAQKEQMKKLKSGDPIFIEQIRAEYPRGEIRNIGSMILYVK